MYSFCWVYNALFLPCKRSTNSSARVQFNCSCFFSLPFNSARSRDSTCTLVSSTDNSCSACSFLSSYFWHYANVFSVDWCSLYSALYLSYAWVRSCYEWLVALVHLTCITANSCFNSLITSSWWLFRRITWLYLFYSTCNACCTLVDSACIALLISFISFIFFYKSRTCSCATSRGTQLFRAYCNLHISRCWHLLYSRKTSIYLLFYLLDYYTLTYLLVILYRAFTTLFFSFSNASNFFWISLFACIALV